MLDPEVVRAAVGRVTSSRVFANAARSQRFLSWVVEQVLAGEKESIKEVVLGIEVFDRAQDFDPRTDTIVRVEAGKLRKRLQEYYETEGAGDPVRIDVPKGAYVPQFQLADIAPSGDPPRQEKRAHRKWFAIGITVLALVTLGLWSLFRGRATQSPDLPTVVVLPLLNLSADPSNEYFADGLTEDLTDSLARTGEVQVVSRTSAFLFKGKQSDVREIGAKLNAAYAVEGSARKEGSRVKVTAQLVRTSDGYQLWSSSFERDLRDIFAAQAEVAEAVTTALRQKLGRSARPATAVQLRTRSVRAFDLYMQGRHAAANLLLLDDSPVEALFRQSIAADPNYALPHLALADLYLTAEILQLRRGQELVGLAKQELKEALRLDANLADAYLVQAAVSGRHEYDWPAADEHIRRALALGVNAAAAHHARASNVLLYQGLWKEVASEERLAEELDPFSPAIRIGAPWMLCMQRQYTQCLAAAQRLSGSDPPPAIAILLATARAGTGDFDGAIAALRPLSPSPMSRSMTATYHAAAGRPQEARRLFEEVTRESQAVFIPSSALAILHLAVGDKRGALDHLERARSSQESFLAFARVAPWFDPLHGEPRFQRLLQSIRLSDEDVSRFQQVTGSVHR